MNFEESLRKYLSDEEIKKLITSFSLNEEKALYLNTLKINEEYNNDYYHKLKQKRENKGAVKKLK